MLAATNTANTIEAEIYGYLDKRFPALAPVAPDTALLDGAIDSLGFLELIMFLGDRFNLSMEDDGLDFQELSTPANLVNFVLRART